MQNSIHFRALCLLGIPLVLILSISAEANNLPISAAILRHFECLSTKSFKKGLRYRSAIRSV